MDSPISVLGALMPPPLVLAILLLAFYTFAFKTIAGRRSENLVVCLMASALGFGIGHLFGDYLYGSQFVVGEVRVVEASLGSWLLLLIANRPYL
ncbi:MAG TPA: hypothetical protein VMP10_02965 [Chloroflexota bacterium]|nr:hypothetical protein [Chloroflexota bacterium]